MKTSLRVFVAACVLALTSFVVVSVGSAFGADENSRAGMIMESATNAGEPSVPSEVLNDRESREKIEKLLDLYEKAKDGDPVAFAKLQAMGKEKGEGMAREEMMELAFNRGLSGAAAEAEDGLRNPVSIANQNFDSAPRYNSAAGSGLVPYRSPAPAFSRNLLVTRDRGTPVQTEPSVCSNPDDPSNVTIAATEYALPYTSMYTSFDAGETWRGPNRVPLTNRAQFGGDPVLACGRGATHEVFMSLGYWMLELGPYELPLTRSDIAVSTSEDGGLNWKQPSIVATNVPGEFNIPVKDPDTGKKTNVEIIAIPFLDKPWIGTGPNKLNRAKDATYVTYTRFVDYVVVLKINGFLITVPLQTTSEIVMHGSFDGGKTWKQLGATTPLTAVVGQEERMNDLTLHEIRIRFVQGSQVDVANNGDLYVAWYNTMDDGIEYGQDAILVAKSSDNGKTWKGGLAAVANEIPYQPRTANFRMNGSAFPQMALGPKGEVYIVYSALTKGKPTDDGDVYFVHGSGKTLEFSKPKRLNEDGTDRLQFYPTVAVGANGTLHAMWGDMRDDPAGLMYNIYYTQSKNGGKTWGFMHQGIREPDTRVSDYHSNPNWGFPRGEFIGDYFAMAPGARGNAYLVWPDTRLGEFGGTNQKIGFALGGGRNSSIPSPEIYLNPGRGSAGQAVTIQASNFQPDMQVFVKVGGNITAGPKTDENGHAEMSVLMPLTASEGVQDVMVFDESGNVAMGSFYAEVGINSLAKGSDLNKVKGTVAKQGNELTARLNSTQAKQNTMETVLYVLLGLVSLLVLALGAAYSIRRFKSVR